MERAGKPPGGRVVPDRRAAAPLRSVRRCPRPGAAGPVLPPGHRCPRTRRRPPRAAQPPRVRLARAPTTFARATRVLAKIDALDFSGVQPVRPVAGGVLLEYPGVGDVQLGGEVRGDRPGHVGGTGQERPEEPDGGSRPAGPPPPPTGTGCATHKSTRPVRHASERLDKDRTVATPSLGPRRRQSTQRA